MDESFALRLRAARQRAGMSQADLGGDRYSGSYVSHLESGRRMPTPPVLRYLSERLGVPVEDLEPEGVGAPSALPMQDTARQLVVHQVNARTAWEHGQHHEVVRIAELGRSTAGEEQADAWWSFTFLEAQALLVLEEHADCIRIGEELLTHPFAAHAPELRAEVHVLLSRAQRSSGHLEAALEQADLAAEAAQRLPAESPQRVHALLGRVSSLAELGRSDEAQAVCEELTAVRDLLHSTHLRGQVAWTLGNVAFLRGDGETGLAEHNQAAKCLSPESDLRGWGRFCRAAAAMRLSWGSPDGVAELLDQARSAILLVGNPGDRQELEITRAELQRQLGDPAAALATLEGVLNSDPGLPPHTRAETDWLRYECLVALEDPAARDAVREAALHYEEAGAFELAVKAWRTHAMAEG